MMNRNLIIFFLFLLISTSSAQSLFDKRYGLSTWSCGRSILETSDGYLSVGYQINEFGFLQNEETSGVLVKMDFNGDTIRTFKFGEGDSSYVSLPSNTMGNNSDEQFTDMVRTADSNYVAVSWDQRYVTHVYDRDVLLVKFDSNLDTIWTVSVSHPFDTSLVPQSIIQTLDSGFAICGKARSYLSSNYVGFILKTDSQGNIIWLHTYNFPGPGTAIWGLSETSFGELIAGGTTIIDDWNDEYAPLLFKVDNLGAINQIYTVPPINGVGGEVIKSNDGNYLFYNTTYPATSVRKIMKFNENDSLIWSRDFGVYDNGGLVTIKPGINGGYVACGMTDIPQGSNFIRAYIIRFDENGDSLWYREFNTQSWDAFWDIEITSDGCYILTGETYDNGSMAIESRYWIVKTDSLGLFTGFHELTNLDSEKLLGYPFPNPVLTEIHIPYHLEDYHDRNSDDAVDIQILLFDASSKQIGAKKVESKSGEVTFDLSYYSSGVYSIVLVVNGYNAGSRLIIKQ